jgi:anti-sigma B factor antagonist
MTTMIAVAERDGLAPAGLRSLRIAGPLTAATAPDLRRRLREETDGEGRVVLDLEAVTGLDASGVAVLLEAARVRNARGGRSLAVRLNPVVMRALKHTGTLTAFNICIG